jgi:hypothetical protein
VFFLNPYSLNAYSLSEAKKSQSPQ